MNFLAMFGFVLVGISALAVAVAFVVKAIGNYTDDGPRWKTAAWVVAFAVWVAACFGLVYALDTHSGPPCVHTHVQMVNKVPVNVCDQWAEPSPIGEPR